MMSRTLHNARLLWVIRECIATTWPQLCRHFNAKGSREEGQLQSQLKELHDAKLIRVQGGANEIYLMFTFRDGSLYLEITPQAEEFLKTLDLSLTQLAQSHPWDRLIVNPDLKRTDGTHYESDLLVFMPFAEALQPVYDDHLKAVANKLKVSIKRADDFFTTHEIMGDIWTALLDTKLVIADCTGRNPNVFYELGLAHAVGRPTILTTQHHDDIPFDLRHRRYIKYEMTPRGMTHFEEELEKTITNALERVTSLRALSSSRSARG